MPTTAKLIVGCVLCLLAVASVASAAEPATRPARPSETLLDSDKDKFALQGKAFASATLTQVPATGAFATAYRVEIRQRPQAAFDIQLGRTLSAPLPRGHTMMLIAWGRAIRPPDGKAEGRADFVVEQAGGTYQKELIVQAALGREWKQFGFPFRSRLADGSSRFQVIVRLGFDPQSVELGGIRLIDFGPDVQLEEIIGQ